MCTFLLQNDALWDLWGGSINLWCDLKWFKVLPCTSDYPAPLVPMCYTPSWYIRAFSPSMKRSNLYNTLRPRQNGRHFADHTYKHIFLNENVRIFLTMRGRQHTFSTHEWMFLWKCQRFRDTKCLKLRGTRTNPHTYSVCFVCVCVCICVCAIYHIV